MLRTSLQARRAQVWKKKSSYTTRRAWYDAKEKRNGHLLPRNHGAFGAKNIKEGRERDAGCFTCNIFVSGHAEKWPLVELAERVKVAQGILFSLSLSPSINEAHS